MTWFLRGLALVGGPALGYLEISRDAQGAVTGLLIALVIIGVERMLESVSLLTVFLGLAGAAAGLLTAKALEFFLAETENVRLMQFWETYSIIVRIAFAYLGFWVTIRKVPELGDLDKDILSASRRRGQEFKVVDTSAIIDGRIVDICETRFLSGTLIVPSAVIKELQYLADSPDPLKRARGRRGLDILARLRENKELTVRILEKDVPELDSVDAKVVRLARELGARLVTTDFNMNKVASLERVVVLNVNDLTTALKPVVLPGEIMSIFVMKEGKEREQGVGYLDDGTMVVVEDGRRHIGKRIEVSVTSIMQTSAGRMIFTKFKSSGERPADAPEPPDRKDRPERHERHERHGGGRHWQGHRDRRESPRPGEGGEPRPSQEPPPGGAAEQP